jgi:hypothetical protein
MWKENNRVDSNLGIPALFPRSCSRMGAAMGLRKEPSLLLFMDAAGLGVTMNKR